MKISYNWLKEFISLKTPPNKLAEDLSLFGHEVESIKKIGNDYILDFEITPNRGDCLSIFGMAREIASLYNLKLKKILYKYPKITKLDKKIEIKLKNKNICSKYLAVIIDNIKVTNSPKWLKDKLAVLGFRSINSIVDITNYLMLELGQPMHAFDYDKISKGLFNIELANPNESLITLDGKERKLDKKTIIIRDDKKIFDLAGIMGGYNSEISKETKTIVLEVAVFDPILIRHTSKILSLTTDASYRYERNVNIENSLYVLLKALNLIKKLNIHAKFSNLYDIKNNKTSNIKIKIDINKINNLIGSNFNENKIKKLLNQLNFIYKNNVVYIPSYRSHDVKIWQDVAEEVARIYGYNNLGISNIIKTKSDNKINDYTIRESIKDILINNSFSEIYSYSFTSEKLLNLLKFNTNELKQVINGISPETKFLRPSLLPSIYETISKNPWAPEIKIFEIGKVFEKNVEKWQLVIASTIKNDKKMIEILKLINIKPDIQTSEQNILNYLKIRKNFYYQIIDISKIKPKSNIYQEKFELKKFKPISSFAPTIRDLAFVVSKNINNSDIQKVIENCNSHILFVELFDEFISDKLGINKKSIAFHIWLQEINKPIDKEKADKIIEKIISEINKNFQGKLR